MWWYCHLRMSTTEEVVYMIHNSWATVYHPIPLFCPFHSPLFSTHILHYLHSESYDIISDCSLPLQLLISMYIRIIGEAFHYVNSGECAESWYTRDLYSLGFSEAGVVDGFVQRHMSLAREPPQVEVNYRQEELKRPTSSCARGREGSISFTASLQVQFPLISVSLSPCIQ